MPPVAARARPKRHGRKASASTASTASTAETSTGTEGNVDGVGRVAKLVLSGNLPVFQRNRVGLHLRGRCRRLRHCGRVLHRRFGDSLLLAAGPDDTNRSSDLEGSRSTEVTRADQNAYVRGEIELEELGERVRARYGLM